MESSYDCFYFNQNPLASSDFVRIQDALLYDTGNLTLVASKRRVNFNKQIMCDLSPVIKLLVKENQEAGGCYKINIKPSLNHYLIREPSPPCNPRTKNESKFQVPLKQK